MAESDTFEEPLGLMPHIGTPKKPGMVKSTCLSCRGSGRNDAGGSCGNCRGTGAVAHDSPPDMVNHPAHYGGADSPYETDKVCVAWGLDKDAYLYNVVKYVSRAGKKGDALEDLQKARWYLNRRIEQMEKAR